MPMETALKMKPRFNRRMFNMVNAPDLYFYPLQLQNGFPLYMGFDGSHSLIAIANNTNLRYNHHQ